MNSLLVFLTLACFLPKCHPVKAKNAHSDSLVYGRSDAVTSQSTVCKSPAVFGPVNPQQLGPLGGELLVYDRLLKNFTITDSMMYDDCGKPYPNGNVCYGVPSGCIEDKKCRLIVNFKLDQSNPDYVVVNLAGETFQTGYVAFAFSTDRFVGRDFVVYCINSALVGKPETPAALYLAMTKRFDAIMQRSRYYYSINFCSRYGYLSPSEEEHKMLACSFALAPKLHLDNGSHIDFKQYPFYLMLASGHYVDSVSKKYPTYGGIKSHHLIQFSSDSVVMNKALRDPIIIYPRTRALILVHGTFAAIAFIFLIPSSMFCAKYGREVNGYDTNTCRRFRAPAWYRNHAFLTIASAPFLLVSLITILVELEWTWRSYKPRPMFHSIVGIFAIVLMAVTFVSGFFFKCEDYSNYNVGETTERVTWVKYLRWIHWLLGNAAYMFAVLSLIITGSLPRSQTPCFVEYFAYLHFAIYVCSHFIMMLDTKRLAKMFDDVRPAVSRLYRIVGPTVLWKKEGISKADFGKDFHKLNTWQTRRRMILFFFLVSLLCAFTISSLLLFPVVLCR